MATVTTVSIGVALTRGIHHRWKGSTTTARRAANIKATFHVEATPTEVAQIHGHVQRFGFSRCHYSRVCVIKSVDSDVELVLLREIKCTCW
jgi:hypothetical protein